MAGGVDEVKEDMPVPMCVSGRNSSHRWREGIKKERERNGPVEKPGKEKGELLESCFSLKEQDAAQVRRWWSYIGTETIHHPA